MTLPFRRAAGLCSALVLLLAGCAGQAPKVPELATTGHHLPGKVVWHELLTPDLDASRKFYGDLLGWVCEPAGPGYLLCRSHGRPVAGMAEPDFGVTAAYWVSLLSVPDLDRAVATVERSGGRVSVAPFPFPARGWVSIAEDPAGATFGVVQTAHGDPPDTAAPLNDWLWNEVWTADPAGAERFYRPLAGYDVGEHPLFGTPHRYLQAGGVPRVGLVKKSDPRIGEAWLPYVRVEDPAALGERAKALGGTVLLAPHPQVRGGSVAIIRDPAGAGVALQKWQP